VTPVKQFGTLETTRRLDKLAGGQEALR
jgi:hypothetical protein